MLTIVKILDMGFFAAFDRPFNPVTDRGYFGPALALARDSIGETARPSSGLWPRFSPSRPLS